MLRNTPLFSRRNPEKEHRTIQSPNFRTLLRVTRLDPMFRIRHIAFRIRRIIFPIRHIFLRIRHIIFRRLLIPSPPPHSTLPTCLSMTHKRIVRLHLRAGLSKKKASVLPGIIPPRVAITGLVPMFLMNLCWWAPMTAPMDVPASLPGCCF